MEGPKSRPTITITTYSASKSSYLRQSIDRQHSQDQKDGDGGATRSDFSTNFFRDSNNNSSSSNNNKNRIGGSQQAQARTGLRNRVLSDLSQIKGPTGSVRGHKDVVRRSLEGIKVAYNSRYTNFSSSSMSPASLLSLSTFFANQLASKGGATASLNHLSLNNTGRPSAGSTNSNLSSFNFGNELYFSEYLERLMEDEQNLCVAYTTTLGVIRRTFEDSKILKSILNLNLVKYEERDIYLNQEYKFQLRMRTGGAMVVPALFVDGQYIGGAPELETMNENGELQVLLAKFKMSKAPSEICLCCGNARFIACQSCNGSRKSTIHHFKFNSIALRCIKCDKNDGLVQCPTCTSKDLSELQLEEATGDKLEPGANGAQTIKLVDGSGGHQGTDENVDINNNNN